MLFTDRAAQTIRADQYCTLAAPLTMHMSKFALLCQAARLLGQVFNAVSSDATDSEDTWLQLDRTLQSMLTASLELREPDYDQITFIYSALTALHRPYISHTASKDLANRFDPFSDERSRRAHSFRQQLTDKISANLIGAECLAYRDPEDMPPWGLFFAYQVCVSQLGSNSREVLDALKAQMKSIDVRWNVAGRLSSFSAYAGY